MAQLFDALQLELTNKCQLDCAECPRRLMSRPVGDMDFDLARMVTSDALDANSKTTLVVNGLGDPILYPHLADYFRFAAELRPGCNIQFFTNLSIPRPKVEALFGVINQCAANFLVATTKHMYDGGGGRAQAVSRFYDENLQVVADITRTNKRVDLHAHMVINKFHSQGDIETFFLHFRKHLDKDHVHISQQLNPWFDLVAHLAGPCGCDPGQGVRPKDGPELCHYPFRTCHLGWDGEMIICCTDDVNQECTFGKVQERGDLLRLWNGDKLNAIREQFNRLFDDKLENAPQPCQKCFRLNWLRKK